MTPARPHSSYAEAHAPAPSHYLLPHVGKPTTVPSVPDRQLLLKCPHCPERCFTLSVHQPPAQLECRPGLALHTTLCWVPAHGHGQVSGCAGFTGCHPAAPCHTAWGAPHRIGRQPPSGRHPISVSDSLGACPAPGGGRRSCEGRCLPTRPHIFHPRAGNWGGGACPGRRETVLLLLANARMCVTTLQCPFRIQGPKAPCLQL